jgi:hypothetical protein
MKSVEQAKNASSVIAIDNNNNNKNKNVYVIDKINARVQMFDKEVNQLSV